MDFQATFLIWLFLQEKMNVLFLRAPNEIKLLTTFALTGLFKYHF